MQTPRYIFADDFSAFETYFKSVPGRRRSFKKGDSLWGAGQPFSPVYYILSGLALTCIHHEEGHRKILSFHGKGTGNLLYLLAEREETEAGPVIYLSQEELADILAANRVNLSRNISRLRQEGIIATSRKQIRILRPDLLAAHCSSETL